MDPTTGEDVPTRLVAERLGADGLRAAYPLIRQAQPTVNLSSWMRFARRFVSRGEEGASGIVAVRYAGQPFPCGLSCFRREPDLCHGVVLQAGHVVALDLLSPETVLTTLLGELDLVARRLGCDAVRVSIEPGPLASLLKRIVPGRDGPASRVRHLA